MLQVVGKNRLFDVALVCRQVRRTASERADKIAGDVRTGDLGARRSSQPPEKLAVRTYESLSANASLLHSDDALTRRFALGFDHTKKENHRTPRYSWKFALTPFLADPFYAAARSAAYCMR
jgi:hypothetical protein